MKVRKNSGLLENYMPEKLISSCLNSGATLSQASQVERKIKSRLFDGITTKEVREMVFGELKAVKPSVARRYEGHTGLKVRTSKIVLESFNKKRIVDSLVYETRLDVSLAKKIAKEVEKELSRMKLNYVTAPLIREIVNVKLLEEGLENTRARYTRLGMPVFDVRALLEHGIEKSNGRPYNPEAVHKLFADQITREYALLSVLPQNLADAHMKGQLNIHDLDYFSTRTHSFSHDLRFFLKKGFKADGAGKYTAVSGPPKNPEVAFLIASRVLAAAQTNCGGGQGLNYFNTFMAPYISGLSHRRVNQLAQMFVFELSQMYGVRGGQLVYSSIDCDLDVPSFLRDVPAVLPNGFVREGVTYGDFEDEAELLFKTLLDVYLQGDYKKKPFRFPKFNARVTSKHLKSKKELIHQLCEVAAKTRTPYFITPRRYSPKILCYQGSSFIMPSDRETLKNACKPGFLRGGVSQLVSINLPQIAYESGGKEGKFNELLSERMFKAKSVLLLKKGIVERILKRRLMPFMSQRIGGRGIYLNPERQGYVIGFVGLNEMVYSRLGEELHESKSALKYGVSVVRRMGGMVDDFKRESELNFLLARTSAEVCSTRFPGVDSRRFPDKYVSRKYANSFQIRPKARVSASRRISFEAPFHPLLKGGALSHIYLNRRNLDPDFIERRLGEIVRSSKISYHHYILK